ncbi:RluA family pseudouridine synthase [Salinicoccus albus]|uniref:RluA family pseudouridine synthase n=1 Tax=Salinicoccus albus TaxID=418756 RepID=UPI000362DEF2
MMQEMKVTNDQDGSRLDRFLAENVPDTSRSDMQGRIREGLVLVNDEVVKPNHKVRSDDIITVEERPVAEAGIAPENLSLNIIHEDDYVAVVEKPKGMVVHPAAGHPSGTLVNGLMYQLDSLSGVNGEFRSGIVHRIDKDTSGLLVIAKDDVSHESLVEQLVDKAVTRKYTALVHGVIPHDKGTVEAPIGRNPKERQSMAVVDGGRASVTHFNVLERFRHFTLVECILETGRTHQIRVHMKYIGYPLAGDPKYGPRKTLETGGQMLHAGTLGFIHPQTGEYKEFSTPLPEIFETVMENIQN